MINNTGSLAFLASGVGRRSAVSVAADSIFLVALCTDALHESRTLSIAALRFRSVGDVGRLRAAMCMILMESAVSRDALDHILGAVSDLKPGIAAGKVAKMRHNSHCGDRTLDVGSESAAACKRLPVAK